MSSQWKIDSRIYIAGHQGMVGSAMMRLLRAQGFSNLIQRTHAELDLTDSAAVADFFSETQPEYVVIAAAKVGGIHANNTYPAEFIRDNLLIQTNLIHQAYLHKVKRLLFLGSSCIYPRDCPQPIKEEYLLTGPLEPTNRPYAIAKISGIEMCWSYNRQYGTKFISVMPTNLYGPGDNYHPENSHVMPALIRRFHEAKCQNLAEVVVWGTGTPRREFLYVDDMATACCHLLNLPDEEFTPLLAADRNDGCPPLINIGYGDDLTIKSLATHIADTVGYTGNIVFDHSKPDGTMRKLMDVSRLKQLGYAAQTTLSEGLTKTYQAFEQGELREA